MGALGCAYSHLTVQITSSFRQGSNLYVGLVLPPAGGKSHVIKALRIPFRDIEDQLRGKWEVEGPERRVKISYYEKSTKRVENELAKPSNTEKYECLLQEAIDYEQELEALLASRSPVVLAGDATPEALAAVLNNNQGKVQILDGEPSILGSIGRYKIRRRGKP